jgi:hypothetical protein
MKAKKIQPYDNPTPNKPNSKSRVSICSNNTSGEKGLRHGSVHQKEDGGNEGKN